MEVVKKDKDKLTAEIEIRIKEEDYKSQVENSLKKYRKQANLPGFRKGMVPMGMVKKMVGTNILVDEINRLLSDNLYKYIGEQNLNILGNPLPKEEENKDIDWDRQKDFDFTYEIGLAPEVKVGISEKDKFEKYKIKITDELVNEQINDIARRYGRMVEVEEFAKGDMLYGTFEELDGKNPKTDGISHSTVLNPQVFKSEKEQKRFVGKKNGDTLELKPTELADEQYVASWLDIDKEEVKKLKSKFRFTIERINRMEPATLNQEFFDKIYGPGQVKSKEEMATRLKEELSRSYSRSSEQLFVRDIQDQLLKKAKLQLPDEFMKRWLKTANEKPLTDEQIEEEYEEYARGLKWQLIENKILKEHNIKVEREEVINYTKGLILQQLGSMGQDAMDDKDLEETALRVLENQDEARKLYDQLYQQKLNELFNSTVKIKEKEISYDDFVKLAGQKKK
jgi:trigger factor